MYHRGLIRRVLKEYQYFNWSGCKIILFLGSPHWGPWRQYARGTCSGWWKDPIFIRGKVWGICKVGEWEVPKRSLIIWGPYWGLFFLGRGQPALEDSWVLREGCCLWACLRVGKKRMCLNVCCPWLDFWFVSFIIFIQAIYKTYPNKTYVIPMW